MPNGSSRIHKLYQFDEWLYQNIRDSVPAIAKARVFAAGVAARHGQSQSVSHPQ
jgi:hypothetical protein